MTLYSFNNWIIPALLAPLAYAGVNFIDKYVVEKEVKDYRGMPIFGTIIGLLMGLIFWLATGCPLLTFRDVFILLLSGALTIWAAAFYFEAISLEDPSSLILLFQMTPVMVLIMSFLFLGERISLSQFFGFLLILASVLGVSDNVTKKGFQPTKAFWLILLVDFMWALKAVLMKFSITENSFTEVLSYESWGSGLGGTILYLLFPKIRNAFNSSVKRIRKIAFGIIFGNELLFVLGKAFTFLAYSLGPAALIVITGSSQVFIGIFMGLALTLFLPQVIKEDISQKNLIKKISLAGVMFLGLILVS